jgi:hypothetical protein
MGASRIGGVQFDPGIATVTIQTMTLVLVNPADEGEFVELENRALGVPPLTDHADQWRRAMRDDGFVRDQREFLELAAQADAETID